MTWAGGSGRVDLIVSTGVVPGVPDPITADQPMARIDIWQNSGGGWRPTEAKAAVPIADLEEIQPLDGRDYRRRGAIDRLVALVATHDQLVTRLDLPDWMRPPGVSVKAVFERGRRSWPGTRLTSLTPEEWALGRVEAFLALAAGVEVGGYRRDLDLLPHNHPARASDLDARG